MTDEQRLAVLEVLECALTAPTIGQLTRTVSFDIDREGNIWPRISHSQKRSMIPVCKTGRRKVS